MRKEILILMIGILLTSCNTSNQISDIKDFSLVQIGISSLPGIDENGKGYKITDIPKESVIIKFDNGNPVFSLKKNSHEIIALNPNDTNFLNIVMKEIFNNLVPTDSNRFVTRGQYAPKLVEFGFIVNNVNNSNMDDFFKQKNILLKDKPNKVAKLLLYHSSLGDQDVTLGPSCVYLSDQSYPGVSKLPDGSFFYFDSDGVFRIWELSDSGYNIWDKRLYDVSKFIPISKVRFDRMIYQESFDSFYSYFHDVFSGKYYESYDLLYGK